MQKTTKVKFFFAQVRSKPGAESTIMSLDSKNEKHVSRLVEILQVTHLAAKT